MKIAYTLIFLTTVAVLGMILSNLIPDIISKILNVIVNYINNIGNFKLSNNVDIENTKIYYYHGTKANEMLAKKTAKYIKRYYPNSSIICFRGKGHCENSLLNPSKMIKELDKILAK